MTTPSNVRRPPPGIAHPSVTRFRAQHLPLAGEDGERTNP